MLLESDCYEITDDALAFAIRYGRFETTLEIIGLAATFCSPDSRLITLFDVEQAIQLLENRDEQTTQPPS